MIHENKVIFSYCTKQQVQTNQDQDQMRSSDDVIYVFKGSLMYDYMTMFFTVAIARFFTVIALRIF